MRMTRPAQFLLIALTGCSTSLYRYHSNSTSPLQNPVPAVGIGPVAMAHLVNPIEDVPPAHSGVFVGHVLFSGGVVTQNDEAGQQNVAKVTAASAQEKYTQTVSQHAIQVVIAAAQQRGATPSTWTTDSLPPLVISPRRGTHPMDGRDNVPLPRFTVTPNALDDGRLATVPPQVDAVVGVYVVHYYSHNAGWFLGQNYGTSAGARYRLFVVTWDAQTGTPLAWTDTTTRFLHENVFQPNSGQVDDFMIDTESMMEKQIRRHLWR
ncbi:MAG: hypothetical protein GWP91_21445 [Rhodobacterales bacterium]|nr:hypothetical protein [Rhodobacterales bacterium]